jgi:hypothetical protein
LFVVFIVGKECGKQHAIFDGDQDEVAADKEEAEAGDSSIEEGEGEEEIEDEVGEKPRVADPRITALAIDTFAVLVAQWYLQDRHVEGGKRCGGGEEGEGYQEGEGMWTGEADEQEGVGECGHKKTD